MAGMEPNWYTDSDGNNAAFELESLIKNPKTMWGAIRAWEIFKAIYAGKLEHGRADSSIPGGVGVQKVKPLECAIYYLMNNPTSGNGGVEYTILHAANDSPAAKLIAASRAYVTLGI